MAVNQEILEGLRTALSRGYPLESAMMSFFNAGYKKEEIEEAARALYTHPSQPLSHPGKATPEQLKKPISYKTQQIETHTFGPSEEEQEEAEKEEAKEEEEKVEVTTKPLKPSAFEKPEEKEEEKKEIPVDKAKAEVSKYEEKTKPKGKLITIILIILLFLMVSGLISIFVFKDQLADFFANLLG